MNRTKLLTVVFLLTLSFITAQDKEITLEQIWNGTFRTERMNVLNSMNNGEQYSVLKYNRNQGTTSIAIYDYKTLEQVDTYVSSDTLGKVPPFSSYHFSNDESKVILATQERRIYRYSKTGVYFVYDSNTKAVEKIYDKPIQEPTFSPDGNKVVFVYMNNIYIKLLDTGETIQVTFDGEKNTIINGVTDWVYEEEFGIVRAFDWNSGSDKLAFIKFDETNVPTFSMDVYGKQLYPKQDVFKYPKAGEQNAIVSLHIFNLDTKTSSNVNPSKNYKDFYIPRLKWTNDPNVLSAQFLNRHQNNLDLRFIDATAMTDQLILTESDKAYVDVTSDLTFLDDNSFIWTSEKDGYNHIYHYSEKGQLINQVTKGNWDVTNYYGFDTKKNRIFYQSVESNSINRDIFSIKINGKNKKKLSEMTGTNSASFSSDFSHFINTYSSADSPPQYTLHESKNGKLLKTIIDNNKVKTLVSTYNISEKEFSTIHINNNDLKMWMIKPSDFDANEAYPLLMFQYSGPGSQQVANRWNGSNDYWYYMLAQQGYIIACVDGRGTGYKGAEFKKVTQNELGKYEVEDQIEAAKQLGSLPYIDKNRIGIWGWSYGGFMSSNALFKGNDVFKMAIAVAPVTSWRFYDSIYTERYMSTPQENPTGYDDNSPLSHVDKLKGDFLLIHGSADDNVHVQNTMRLVEALIQADKQFEWMIYPDKNHSIYGGNTRLHLYKKMTNFIHKTLGD